MFGNQFLQHLEKSKIVQVWYKGCRVEIILVYGEDLQLQNVFLCVHVLLKERKFRLIAEKTRLEMEFYLAVYHLHMHIWRTVSQYSFFFFCTILAATHPTDIGFTN